MNSCIGLNIVFHLYISYTWSTQYKLKVQYINMDITGNVVDVGRSNM